MSKTDLADAYMRVWIKIDDVPKLSVAIPPAMGDDEQLIGFHLSLPMGYIESTPFFCAASETVADFANHSERRTTPHTLEALAATKPAKIHTACAGVLSDLEETALEHHLRQYSTKELTSCLEYTDVYVDDFILLMQSTRAMRKSTIRNLFHHINRVFRPNDAHNRNMLEVNSVKKLRKGDAYFTHIKKILGWMIDSIKLHLIITTSRFAKMRVLLNGIKGQRRTTTKMWQRMLDTLRSLAPGVAGGRGLFSVLQAAMHREVARVRIPSSVYQILHLWRHMAD